MVFEAYTEYLSEIFWRRLIVAIVLFIGLFIAIVWVFMRKESQSIKSLFIGFEIVLILGASASIIPYGIDVIQKSYVVYEGNYTVQEIVIEKSRGCSVILSLDGEIVKLGLDACSNHPVPGEHEGTLVYSKNTKLLFDWEIKNGNDMH